MAFRKLLEIWNRIPDMYTELVCAWLYRQPYLADATGITTFCYEIRLSRSWSQVAKSVAVNTSSADLSEHSLMGLRGWGEVVLGSLSWPHLGWGRRMKEKEPGSQDGGKEAPGVEALSHPPYFLGSDPELLSLMSQLPSCSQSCWLGHLFYLLRPGTSFHLLPTLPLDFHSERGLGGVNKMCRSIQLATKLGATNDHTVDMWQMFYFINFESGHCSYPHSWDRWTKIKRI